MTSLNSKLGLPVGLLLATVCICVLVLRPSPLLQWSSGVYTQLSELHVFQAAAPECHSLPNCTFPLLKQIYLTTGYFPDSITWNHQVALVSDDCQMPIKKDKNIGQCLLRKNITKIAMLGDSNINRFFDVFRRHCAGACKLSKLENSSKLVGQKPALGYYTSDESALVARDRGCHRCRSKTYTCAVNDRVLRIEYIAMDELWDLGITSAESRCSSAQQPCPRHRSSQQFIFKRYFADTGYPDMILHFLNAHDQGKLTAGEMLLAAEMMGRMYELYVPRTSRVVLFSKWHEEVLLKPPEWRNVTYEEKYNTTEQITRHNRAAADGFRRAMRDNDNLDVFFDMFKFGSGKAEEWGTDGVHKTGKYYGKLLQYFTLLLCHE